MKGVAFQSHFPLLLLLLHVKDGLVNLFAPLQGCSYFTEVILWSGDRDFLYAAFTAEGQEQAVIEVGDKTVARDCRSRLIYSVFRGGIHCLVHQPEQEIGAEPLVRFDLLQNRITAAAIGLGEGRL